MLLGVDAPTVAEAVEVGLLVVSTFTEAILSPREPCITTPRPGPSLWSSPAAGNTRQSCCAGPIYAFFARSAKVPMEVSGKIADSFRGLDQ